MNINDYKDGNGNVEVSETLVSDLIDEFDTKANKLMPNAISATLINDFTGVILYQKNDLGQVFVDLSVKRATTVGAGTGICYLPEGYRPRSYVVFVGKQSVVGNNIFIEINNEGAIFLSSTTDGTNFLPNENLAGQVTFQT